MWECVLEGLPQEWAVKKVTVLACHRRVVVYMSESVFFVFVLFSPQGSGIVLGYKLCYRNFLEIWDNLYDTFMRVIYPVYFLKYLFC